SDREQELLQEALKHTLAQNEMLTTREKRSLRYDIVENIEDKAFENLQAKDTDNLADLIVDMGLYNNPELYFKILEQPKSTQILQFAYELTSILRANKNIVTATERAAKIIFALKNFSRQDQSGEKKDADINESLQITLTLYQNQLKHGIKVIRNFADLPQYKCFIDELSQVWTNLIYNAIQAMGNEGTLEITTKTEENKNILISISDTGGGIPKDIQNRIFEPFFTTKKAGEGRGLGIDIFKKIVEKHEGKIWFESKDGVGTTFFVSLPIAQR
ncbi:MAG: GHKL domain-containing protein, partial [Bernardetiaceae bacterium]|nr:GHKL domain-containing protein [Bernardetiaceae bacterium]